MKVALPTSGLAEAEVAPKEIDREGFAILVTEHHRRLLAYSMALVRGRTAAEDLVQEAFLAAYSNLSSFDPRRDFGAWVRGILRNKFREWVRQRREMPMGDELLDALDRQHQGWDQEAPNGETLFTTLQSCLLKLSGLLRQAVECFYLKQLSGADSAKRLNIGQAVLRKRLQRARQQLGRCMRQEMEIRHGKPL